MNLVTNPPYFMQSLMLLFTFTIFYFDILIIIFVVILNYTCGVERERLCVVEANILALLRNTHSNLSFSFSLYVCIRIYMCIYIMITLWVKKYMALEKGQFLKRVRDKTTTYLSPNRFLLDPSTNSLSILYYYIYIHIYVCVHIFPISKQTLDPS